MKKLLLSALAALIIVGPLGATASAEDWGRQSRYRDGDRYDRDRDDRREWRGDRYDNGRYDYRQHRRDRDRWQRNDRDRDWGRRDRDRDRYRNRYDRDGDGD